MHRIPVSLAVVVVLLVGELFIMGRSTNAHEDIMADHPLVGAWLYHNPPEDPNPYTYGVFHDDGTYIEVTDVTTGVGVWQATGERAADVTVFYQDIKSFSDEYEPGIVKMREAVTVDASGTMGTAPFTIESRNRDGTILFAGGPFKATMTRLEVDPMEMIGAPSTGTPTS